VSLIPGLTTRVGQMAEHGGRGVVGGSSIDSPLSDTLGEAAEVLSFIPLGLGP
jgi:hypothetical protein